MSSVRSSSTGKNTWARRRDADLALNSRIATMLQGANKLSLECFKERIPELYQALEGLSDDLREAREDLAEVTKELEGTRSRVESLLLEKGALNKKLKEYRKACTCKKTTGENENQGDMRNNQQIPVDVANEVEETAVEALMEVEDVEDRGTMVQVE